MAWVTIYRCVSKGVGKVGAGELKPNQILLYSTQCYSYVTVQPTHANSVDKMVVMQS